MPPAESNPQTATASDPDDWITPLQATKLIGCKTTRHVRDLFNRGVRTPGGTVITLRFQRKGGVRKVTRRTWVEEYLQRVAEAFADPLPAVFTPPRETPSQEAERFRKVHERVTAKLNKRRAR